ncbi:MAG: permease [Sciscionella sp.]
MATHQENPEIAATVPAGRAAVLGTLVFLVIAVAGVTWAKWWPYAHKLVTVAARHTLGPSILTGHAATPPAPSWHAALDYGITYFNSIWVALVAALLIAAAVEAFLPRRWLLGVLAKGPRRLGGTFAGGLLSMPTMMCTCCTAPVTVSLRRRGASAPAALAYWVGNPTLNPAVLAFMAIVLPWPWVTVRIVGGVALVFVITALAGRRATGRAEPARLIDHADDPVHAGPAIGRFARALGRLTITLIPEYIIIVLALGALRGWLFPFAGNLGTWVLLAVPVLAIAGTLFVIPTAGEIPIIQGLLLAGIGTGPAAALLITLPALSLPSLVMVGRAFPRRVLLALSAAVIMLGIISAAVLAALPA